MIRFKDFLNESQWMYHGSVEPNLKTIERNKINNELLDVSIGAHFAENASSVLTKSLVVSTTNLGMPSVIANLCLFGQTRLPFLISSFTFSTFLIVRSS